MELIKLPKIKIPTIVTIGTFDGVHLGHISIFNQIKNIRDNFSQKSEILSLIFKKSPKQIISPQNEYTLICPLEERLKLIRSQGVNYVIPIDFDKKLRYQTAAEFLYQLKKNINIQAFVIGSGTSIGNDQIRLEKDLRKITNRLEIELFLLPNKTFKNEKISSSQIKKFITNGEIENIKKCLGRNFSLTGKVIKGNQRGKTLGYPTANLELNIDQCIPKDGIYSTQSFIGTNKKISVTSVGKNPTFESKNVSTMIETHILDFNNDIYDKKLTIEFLSFLRPQIKYQDIYSLKTQMEIDVSNVKKQIT
jgi:riboflavin kinase/FMN adenylyltransferase